MPSILKSNNEESTFLPYDDVPKIESTNNPGINAGKSSGQKSSNSFSGGFASLIHDYLVSSDDVLDEEGLMETDDDEILLPSDLIGF